MSQFPLPVNLALELQEFIAKLAEAKSLYKSFKGDVEGDPVRIGGGGGGVVQGNGTRPPMVMQPPKFDYQGGGHATVQMNPVLLAAARGAVNSGNSPAINAIASNMGVTAQQIMQAVAGTHNSPNPAQSSGSWGGAGYVRHSSAYPSPIGPPAAPMYGSPIGPPSPFASYFSGQYSSPIGPSRGPAQYSSPIGPANPRGGADFNQYSSPIGPEGAQSSGSGGGGIGGIAGQIARRAAVGVAVYLVTREIDNIASFAVSSARAGADPGGQASAYSSFFKNAIPGIGSAITAPLDIQLANTGLQNSYQNQTFGRGANLANTNATNYGLSQGSNSLSRNLALIDARAKSRRLGYVGGALNQSDLPQQDSTSVTGGDVALGLFNPFGSIKAYRNPGSVSSDESQAAQNDASFKYYRNVQTRQLAADKEQTELEKKNSQNDFLFATARMDIGANAQKLANNFRPRAGAAVGILGNFGVDASEYGAIQNPTDADKARLTAQANVAISQLGGIQHDINQDILSARPTRITAYESPLEYRDASNENLGDADGSVKQSMQQILRILEQAMAHHKNQN